MDWRLWKVTLFTRFNTHAFQTYLNRVQMHRSTTKKTSARVNQSYTTAWNDNQSNFIQGDLPPIVAKKIDKPHRNLYSLFWKCLYTQPKTTISVYCCKCWLTRIPFRNLTQNTTSFAGNNISDRSVWPAVSTSWGDIYTEEGHTHKVKPCWVGAKEKMV